MCWLLLWLLLLWLHVLTWLLLLLLLLWRIWLWTQDWHSITQMRSSLLLQEPHVALAADIAAVHNALSWQPQMPWVVTVDLEGCIAVESITQGPLEPLVLHLTHPGGMI